MIQKFATICGSAECELLNLNHTGSSMILVSLLSAKFAQAAAAEWRRLRRRDTNWKPSGNRPGSAEYMLRSFLSGSTATSKLPQIANSFAVTAMQSWDGNAKTSSGNGLINPPLRPVPNNRAH